MAIAKEAIEAFIAARGPEPPPVKGQTPEWLYALIEGVTGLAPTFKNTPRQAQLEGLAFALWAERALLYYAPRTGKTGITLYWLEHLKRLGKLKRALIIAHAPIGVDEWEGQYKLYCDLDVRFVRTENNAFDQLCTALDSNCDVIIISKSTVQALFTVKRENRKKKMKLYADLEKLRAFAPLFNVFVIDEIHKWKDQTTVGFQQAAELAKHSEYRLGLSGTPFARDPYKVWAQAYLMDDGAALHPNYYFFEQAFGKKEYNHFARTKTAFVFEQKKLPVLNAKLVHMMLFCELTEVHDVNVLAGVIRLQLSDGQRKLYREIIQYIIDKNIQDEEELENNFVKLRQIASGFTTYIDDNGVKRTVDFIEPAKLTWLEDFLAEVGKGLKIILVHEFTHSGELITKLLEKLKIRYGWIYGATIDRMAIKNAFQEGNLQVLVLNWQTGGTAINLSAADYMIFYESPVSAIARKQVESRPLDRGDRLLVMDDMICAPVEQKILDYLKEGKSLAQVFRSNPKQLVEDLSI